LIPICAKIYPYQYFQIFSRAYIFIAAATQEAFFNQKYPAHFILSNPLPRK